MNSLVSRVAQTLSYEPPLFAGRDPTFGDRLWSAIRDAIEQHSRTGTSHQEQHGLAELLFHIAWHESDGGRRRHGVRGGRTISLFALPVEGLADVLEGLTLTQQERIAALSGLTLDEQAAVPEMLRAPLPPPDMMESLAGRWPSSIAPVARRLLALLIRPKGDLLAIEIAAILVTRRSSEAAPYLRGTSQKWAEVVEQHEAFWCGPWRQMTARVPATTPTSAFDRRSRFVASAHAARATLGDHDSQTREEGSHGLESAPAPLTKRALDFAIERPFATAATLPPLFSGVLPLLFTWYANGSDGTTTFGLPEAVRAFVLVYFGLPPVLLLTLLSRSLGRLSLAAIALSLSVMLFAPASSALSTVVIASVAILISMSGIVGTRIGLFSSSDDSDGWDALAFRGREFWLVACTALLTFGAWAALRWPTAPSYDRLFGGAVSELHLLSDAERKLAALGADHERLFLESRRSSSRGMTSLASDAASAATIDSLDTAADRYLATAGTFAPEERRGVGNAPLRHSLNTITSAIRATTRESTRAGHSRVDSLERERLIRILSADMRLSRLASSSHGAARRRLQDAWKREMERVRTVGLVVFLGCLALALAWAARRDEKTRVHASIATAVLLSLLIPLVRPVDANSLLPERPGSLFTLPSLSLAGVVTGSSALTPPDPARQRGSGGGGGSPNNETTPDTIVRVDTVLMKETLLLADTTSGTELRLLRNDIQQLRRNLRLE